MPGPRRGRDDEDDPRSRLGTPGVLALAVAVAAVAGATALPLLQQDGQDELAGESGWTGATVCRVEPEGACVERDAAAAQRLADALLPLEPVPEDQVTCLGFGERYTVVLRSTAGASATHRVSSACEPLEVEGERFRVDDDAREAVATAWSEG